MLESLDTAVPPKLGPTELAVQPSLEDGDEIAPPDVVRRLDVLEADKELAHDLMMAGYQGPEWKAFTETLASYGLPVITGWIRTNKIVQKCREKGFPCPAFGQRPRTIQDVHDIATDTVVDGIQEFRLRVLEPRKWDPGKGASLKTFFIGQCLLQFPNAYRRVMKKNTPEHVAAELMELACGHRPLSVDRLAELARCAALPLDNPKMMVAARAMGYSNEEISAFLGRSKRSVSSTIYRHKRRRRQRANSQ